MDAGTSRTIRHVPEVRKGAPMATMLAMSRMPKPATGRPDRLAELDPALLRRMHGLMVRARELEERLITMNKSGEGFFWIGGPGEEAWNVPLGLQVKKGRGVDHDYLHLHYRSSGLALALGTNVGDVLRQMRSVATDPFSKGRNFVNHFAIPEWNVLPVTPTIETQYSTSIGTAIAHARHGGDAVTIV